MEAQTSSQIISRLEAPMWFASTRFMKQDIDFINQLLQAPIYKQDIPNHYERLTLFMNTVHRFSKQVDIFIKEIANFKKSLEKYPEEDTPSIDEYYYGRHKYFMDGYLKLDTRFLELKSDVFTYLSGALLTHKSL